MMLYLTLALTLLAAGDSTESLAIEATDDVRRVTVIARIPASLTKSIPAGKLDSVVARRWLQFTLIDKDGKLGAAIFGKYRRDGDQLIFTPRYGLVHGTRYRATFVPAPGGAISKDYRVPPRKATPPAVVERIYPSADVLPANQLKFYLHFSRPMREGRAIFDRLQLLDEKGKPVHDPWRRTELWTADAKRFTLWIHPGRVKQGVNLREEFGPVLEPGKTYTLVIGPAVQDTEGQPLGKPFVKKFKAAAEDYRRPLPQNWKLTPPRVGTRDPLKLAFGEPLDHALLHRCLQVRDAAGTPVAGRIQVGPKETSCSLQPREPWTRGDYALHVNRILEDLAGNTPTRVFDTDLQKPAAAPPRLFLKFRPTD